MFFWHPHLFCFAYSKCSQHQTNGSQISISIDVSLLPGNMIENMIITCGTKAEVMSWLEALKNHVVQTQSTTSSKPVSLQVSKPRVLFSNASPTSLQVRTNTFPFKQLKPASVAQLDAPSDWRTGDREFNPRRGRQHSFVGIDHEIFSTVILSLPLIQEGQLSVSGERMCTILVNHLED